MPAIRIPDEAPIYRAIEKQPSGSFGSQHDNLEISAPIMILSDIRKLWTGKLVLNRPDRSREDIGKDAARGIADMEAYGQMILANPDFLARLKADAPLNAADRNTFFGGTEMGYTGYSSL